ncbi:MAG: FliI/YscN family ATPase [Gammaproteobacteria bacterium]
MTPTANVHRQRLARVGQVDTVQRVGHVARAFGTLIRVTGIRARIGELCELRNPDDDFRLVGEVVGIAGGETLLTPLGSLEGLSAAAEVTATGHRASVAVGEQLKGRVLDAHGVTMDDGPELVLADRMPVYGAAPNPLTRQRIAKRFDTGVRSIDSMLTMGEGQRVGIFASAGGGKSTLMGMLARRSDADVNVIVLVGERGREVSEFIQDSLGEEGMKRSVVVVATSDRPALERSRAAYVGTAIAEYFREKGQRVLLLVDSITRFARALRDVGLAVGEPPVRRGFTPTVFSSLPLLFERAGNSANGTMTAVYSVLVEDDNDVDPIAEETRSIIDGHIVLSKKLASANHYPAIDVLRSISRLMPKVTDDEHRDSASTLREYLARYEDIELLLQLGEYEPGKDATSDAAIQYRDAINQFLRQGEEEVAPANDTEATLKSLFR